MPKSGGDPWLVELQPGLRTYIRKKVADPHAADDILQTVLMAAQRARPALRDPAKLEHWARKIALNAIRRHHLDSRRSWVELHEAAIEARPARRKSLLQEFDGMTRRIAAMHPQPRNLAVLVLRFGLDWSPAEIAAALSLRPQTVYKTLQRARDAGPSQPPSPEQEFALKQMLTLSLWNAATNAVYGETWRNLDLAEEALALARLTAMQYPKKHAAAGLLAHLCFLMARLKHQRGADMPAPGSQPLWRREHWDRALVEEGETWVARCRALQPPRADLLMMENLSLLYGNAPLQEAGLRQVFANYEEYIRLTGQTGQALQAAQALREYAGPLAAAKYLEGYANQRFLRDCRMTYWLLGRLYFEARQWRLARANLNKFLRWASGAAMRKATRDLVAQCQKHLKKSKSP